MPGDLIASHLGGLYCVVGLRHGTCGMSFRVERRGAEPVLDSADPPHPSRDAVRMPRRGFCAISAAYP